MNRNVGRAQDSKMHGNVFRKIDDFRGLLDRLSAYTGEVVTVNRMYLSNEAVMLNVTVLGFTCLISMYEDDFEVSKVLKTSQITKHRVSYRQIENASFLELFL